MANRMKGPFEGRRRWRSKDPKKERPPGSRVPMMAAMLRALIILMFGILIIQLINLQVIHGAAYKEQSAINAVREVPIPAARGLIYDRNGTLLVENTARFSVTITPPAASSVTTLAGSSTATSVSADRNRSSRSGESTRHPDSLKPSVK